METDFSRYRMTFDIHTHTVYSPGTFRPHGKGTMEENVRAAVEKGLDAVAISDHGPGHLFYGEDRNRLPEMREEIRRLQEKYPQIRIFLSVEANVIQNHGNCLDVQPEEFGRYDFVLAGYHFGTLHAHMLGNWLDSRGIRLPGTRRALTRANTAMNIAAIRNNNLRMLTHPGDKGRVDMAALARACAETDTWMEISTWHSHLTVEEIRIAMKENVKFVISSDAHTPERVGSFEGGLARAFEAGLPLERIVNIEER